MTTSESKGVYQLPNGMWGYRYAYMLNVNRNFFQSYSYTA